MVSRALKPARSHGSDSQLLPVVTFPLFHPHHMSLFWNEETEWKYVPFAPVKPCTFRCSLKGPSMPWNSRKRYSYLFFFWSPVLACLCLFSLFTPSWVFQVDLYSNQCLNSCLLARGVHSSLRIVCFQSPCMMRYNITWCHCIDQRMCGMQVNCPVGCSYQLPLFICFSLWETGL